MILVYRFFLLVTLVNRVNLVEFSMCQALSVGPSHDLLEIIYNNNDCVFAALR